MTAFPTGARSEGPRGFEGFRAGQRATAIPVQFFTEVLPEIQDPDELRVTLYALYAVPRPGSVAAMRVSALAAEPPLARALGERALEATRAAVEAAARRGTLLLVPLEDGDAIVLLNNDSGRRLRDRILAGTEPPPGAPSRPRVTVEVDPVRAVYEQEIGTLTPSVGAALAEAEQAYPAGWIVDALREAARQNKRSWSYVEAILRRWQAEGRNDEATTGHPGRTRDPYAHLYRRD